MNEQDQFLKQFDAPEESTVLDQNLDPNAEQATDGQATDDTATADADDEQKLRNRRERRLSAKLEAERMAGIQLAARLEAITEAKKATDGESAEYLKAVERIYGTDTPESTTATELLKAALKGVKEEAKREALEAYQEERQKEEAAVRREEQELDTMVEEIEDEYNTELNDATKKGFFSLLEKMSPKDTSGNIIAYADPHAVWEMYQANTKKGTDNRAKALASQSLTRSGASQDSKLPDDAAVRFLKDNGII